MPKQRDLIRMTDDEISEFLDGPRTMSIATIGPDGRPHLIAMWYGFFDGAPAFETYAKSQKVLNLRRDARITCMVEDGDRYEILRGVELVGRAEIIEDPDQVLRIAESVIGRYNPRVEEEQVKEMARIMARKRIGVVVRVERVVSWDHSKLGMG